MTRVLANAATDFLGEFVDDELKRSEPVLEPAIGNGWLGLSAANLQDVSRWRLISFDPSQSTQVLKLLRLLLI